MRTSIIALPVLLIQGAHAQSVIHTAEVTYARPICRELVYPDPSQIIELPDAISQWVTIHPSSYIEHVAHAGAYFSLAFPIGCCGNGYSYGIDLKSEVEFTQYAVGSSYAVDSISVNGTFPPSGAVGEWAQVDAHESVPLGDLIDLDDLAEHRPELRHAAHPGCEQCDEMYNAALHSCCGLSWGYPISDWTSSVTIHIDFTPDPLTQALEICQSEPNSTSVAAQLELGGTQAVAANALFASVRSLPPNAPGFLLMSRTQAFVPYFGGNSSGHLCLGGQISRFSNDVQVSNLSGEVGYQIQLDELPYGQVVLPGETMIFQYWFRDWDGTSATNNTSSAVAVGFS